MKNLINLLLTIAFLLIITSLTVIYSGGYRISGTKTQNNSTNYTLTKTGILAIRSIPDGAKVYIDNQEDPVTATNDTLTSLKPGFYKIRVEKEGFETWIKTLEVYSELVTDITAVLVLKSPRLEPITNYDVETFSISNDSNIIAYTTRTNPKPGLWILNLSYSPVSVFKSNSTILAKDNSVYSPSLADKLIWSKDDENLVAQLNNQAFLVYSPASSLIGSNDSVKVLNQVETAKLLHNTESKWFNQFTEKKITLINKQTPPDYIKSQVFEKNNIWSPDYFKFFYLKDSEDLTKKNIVIYNSEEPLPVGEKRVYDSIYIKNDAKVYWYSDSYHLIIVEPDINNYYKVSLIRVDGSNKTTIYNGLLASDQAYSTPGGDKIIVLINLKEGSNKNLYTVAIR